MEGRRDVAATQERAGGGATTSLAPAASRSLTLRDELLSLRSHKSPHDILADNIVA
jgi:hypothetical protein